jgi:hypothetical protein
VSTVSLRNKSGEVIYLGSPGGRRVDVDEVVKVEGELAKKQPDDAYLIGEGDDARLYPHSVWDAETKTKPADKEKP